MNPIKRYIDEQEEKYAIIYNNYYDIFWSFVCAPLFVWSIFVFLTPYHINHISLGSLLNICYGIMISFYNIYLGFATYLITSVLFLNAYYYNTHFENAYYTATYCLIFVFISRIIMDMYNANRSIQKFSFMAEVVLLPAFTTYRYCELFELTNIRY